jgi:hypothetical protein
MMMGRTHTATSIYPEILLQMPCSHCVILLYRKADFLDVFRSIEFKIPLHYALFTLLACKARRILCLDSL